MTPETEALRPEVGQVDLTERRTRDGRVFPPEAFRSLAWGAAPPAGLRKYAGTRGGLTLYAPSSRARPADLFGVPVTSELYYFAHGRFYLGQVFLDGRENFLRMRAALMATYGKPALRNDLTQVYAWVWRRAKVEVRLCYQGRYEKSTVELKKHSRIKEERTLKVLAESLT